MTDVIATLCWACIAMQLGVLILKSAILPGSAVTSDSASHPRAANMSSSSAVNRKQSTSHAAVACIGAKCTIQGPQLQTNHRVSVCHLECTHLNCTHKMRNLQLRRATHPCSSVAYGQNWHATSTEVQPDHHAVFQVVRAMQGLTQTAETLLQCATAQV